MTTHLPGHSSSSTKIKFAFLRKHYSFALVIMTTLYGQSTNFATTRFDYLPPITTSNTLINDVYATRPNDDREIFVPIFVKEHGNRLTLFAKSDIPTTVLIPISYELNGINNPQRRIFKWDTLVFFSNPGFGRNEALFDCTAKTWDTKKDLVPSWAALSVTSEGKLLVVGGLISEHIFTSEVLRNVTLYDSSSVAGIPLPQINQGRTNSAHGILKMDDGKREVMIVAGGNAGLDMFKSCEYLQVNKPIDDKWEKCRDLPFQAVSSSSIVWNNVLVTILALYDYKSTPNDRIEIWSYAGPACWWFLPQKKWKPFNAGLEKIDLNQDDSILYLNGDKLCVKSSDYTEYCITDLKSEQWAASGIADTVREMSRPIGSLTRQEVQHCFPPKYLLSKPNEHTTNYNCKYCCICRNDIDDKSVDVNTQIAYTSCGHTYHRECIKKWMTKKPSCPVCQETITPGGTLYEEN